MKLTKQQRHMAYMIMLAEAESSDPLFRTCRGATQGIGSTSSGFCAMLGVIWEMYFKYEQYMLPELKAKETKPESTWKFRSWVERKAALRQCIEETADAWPK